nr:hypothetical protein [Candidatus Thorarchaeota archaeon]
MGKLAGFLKQNNFLKNKMLRRIFLVSVVLSIGLPLSYLFFIHPSFEKLLTQDKIDDSISIANYLSSLLPQQPIDISKENIPAEVIKELEKYKRSFDLMKIKIYSKHGETVFSTEETEVGSLNRGAIFGQLLPQGEVKTHIVLKNDQTIDGDTLSFDVIETYVPLLHGNNFL